MVREHFMATRANEPAMIPPSSVVLAAVLRMRPQRPSIKEISDYMFLSRHMVDMQGCPADITDYFQTRSNFIECVGLLEQCIIALRIQAIKPNPGYFNVPPHVYHWLGDIAHQVIAMEKVDLTYPRSKHADI